MLFTELKDLTRGEADYDEFLEIEKLYMADEAMTKRQAAALWSRMYGPACQYKSKREAASRLHYCQMSRIWNELYGNKDYGYKDTGTGLSFTLLSWVHPKLGKNVLTLAVLLKERSPTAGSIVMPLPMTEIGENNSGVWLHPATPGLVIMNP